VRGGGGLCLKTWNADLKQILIIFGIEGITLELNSLFIYDPISSEFDGHVILPCKTNFSS
jgi:hypothetical protein